MIKKDKALFLKNKKFLHRLSVRQWVLSLPKRLRYHLQHDRQAFNSALSIFLDQIECHLHEQ